MMTIFKRDFRSYFTSVIGFVYLAAFLFFAGMYFSLGSLMSASSDMRTMFTQLLNMFMFLIPLLTMKLVSEERKQKTDVVLLTAPVNLFSVVFSKYLAALSVFLIGLGTTALHTAVVFIFGTPDVYTILGNYLGLTLVAGAMIAIGLFSSSISENQIVAAVVSFALIFILWMISWFADFIPNQAIARIFVLCSMFDRYTNIANGLLNPADVFYYLSIAAIFIFLTVRVMERRRWS